MPGSDGTASVIVLFTIVSSCVTELLLVNFFSLFVLSNYGINYQKKWYQPEVFVCFYIASKFNACVVFVLVQCFSFRVVVSSFLSLSVQSTQFCSSLFLLYCICVDE